MSVKPHEGRSDALQERGWPVTTEHTGLITPAQTNIQLYDLAMQLVTSRFRGSGKPFRLAHAFRDNLSALVQRELMADQSISYTRTPTSYRPRWLVRLRRVLARRG